MFIIIIFVFLFGLIVGSFINVVIFRLETGEQMVTGRSHCRECGHVLEWYDLFPLVSFLALLGKCRYCGKKISWQYPIVELATAILFVLVFIFSAFGSCFFTESELDLCDKIVSFYPTISLFYLFFVSSVLIIVFVYDLKHYIIPDKIIYLAIIIVFSFRLFEILEFANWEPEIKSLLTVFNPFIASLLAGGFFLSIVFATRGNGMGGGDVKLAFLMGLVVGWPKILIALFLAFTLGAVCGIILIITKKKTLKSSLPFGPFLVLGTFAAIFYGEKIVKWYSYYLF